MFIPYFHSVEYVVIIFVQVICEKVYGLFTIFPEM